MISIEKLARGIGLNVKAAAEAASVANVEPCVIAAARVGEAALRAEVGKLGRVTGNLADSIGTRVERGTWRVAADVGFFGPGSKHAHLVEFGTVIRYRTSKGVSSSWNTRGRWVGVGVYPVNFVTRATNLGAMPAFRPLETARGVATDAMTAAAMSRLARVGEKTLAAAVA
jgi:hypothetical protein